MTKKVRRPNVNKGNLIPLGNGFSLAVGKNPNKIDDIDIGPNNENGLSVNHGEILQQTKDGVKVYSAEPILDGQSPASLLLKGFAPNKVFNAQEQYKKDNRIKDDGSTYAKGGYRKDAKSSSGDTYYDIVKTRRDSIRGALTRAGFDKASIDSLTPNILKQQILEGGWVLNRKDNNFGGMKQNDQTMSFDSEDAFQDAYIQMLDKRWHNGKPDSLSWRSAKNLDDWARILNREDLNLTTEEAWKNYNKGRKGDDFVYLYAPQWKNGIKSYRDKLKGVDDRTSVYLDMVNQDFPIVEQNKQKEQPIIINYAPAGSKYYTKLNPRKEREFRAWYDNLSNRLGLDKNPDDIKQGYDYRGYFQQYGNTNVEYENPNFHFPDTYKQPWHETFSNESKYAKGIEGVGYWDGDTFIPGSFNNLMKQSFKMGGIHIKPENRGKFTAAAKQRGLGVQEFASKVLANKENYSSTLVKRANFAKNAAGWNHRKKALYGIPPGTEGSYYDINGNPLFNTDLNPAVKIAYRNNRNNSPINIEPSSSVLARLNNPTLNLEQPNITLDTPNIDLGEFNPNIEITQPSNASGVNTNRVRNNTYRPFSLSNAIGTGINLVGNLAVGLINQNAINKLKAPTLRAYNINPAKLKTRVNIQPQIDKMREIVGAATRNAWNNSASSQTAYARSLGARYSGLQNAQDIFARKENEETRLINQDLLNQQQVRDRNVTNAQNIDNQNIQNRVNLQNQKALQTAENWASVVNSAAGAIAGPQGALARRDARFNTASNLAMMSLANPDAAKLINNPDILDNYFDNYFRMLGDNRFYRRNRRNG